MPRREVLGLQKRARGIEWYDRNPSVVHKSYTGDNVEPHSTEQRWTYTVPKGRMAFIEIMDIVVIRREAASSVGLIDAHVCYKPYGGDVAPILVGLLLDNNVGAKVERGVGQALVVLEYDKLEAHTFDESTGGSASYRIVLKVTEFDA